MRYTVWPFRRLFSDLSLPHAHSRSFLKTILFHHSKSRLPLQSSSSRPRYHYQNTCICCAAQLRLIPDIWTTFYAKKNQISGSLEDGFLLYRIGNCTPQVLVVWIRAAEAIQKLFNSAAVTLLLFHRVEQCRGISFTVWGIGPDEKWLVNELTISCYAKFVSLGRQLLFSPIFPLVSQCANYPADWQELAAVPRYILRSMSWAHMPTTTACCSSFS